MLSDLMIWGGGIAAGLAVIFGVLATVFWRGGKAEGDRRDAQAARDYRDTRRRMDDATGDDPGPEHVREWLRERGEQSKRNL